MAMLRQSDFENVEQFLRGLYRHRWLHPLIWYVLQELPAVVGSTQVTWNHVMPFLGDADVMAWPEQTDHATYQDALGRSLNDHPLITNFLRTGDPRAYKISDFLTQHKFHNTPLYDELYRGLGYEDQFAMNLSPLGPQWLTVVVARDGPTFIERDRMLLNLLRPHIAQAYRQVLWMSRLAGRFDSERTVPATSRIVLDARGAILHYPPRAQRWISRYCEHLPTAPQRLPDSVQAWYLQARQVHAGKTTMPVVSPLTVRRQGRQLRIHFDAGEVEVAQATLLLEERIDGAGLPRPNPAGLTPRELEVLRHVESGKRNDEIAAELGIRPRTVKKHLEHTFDKLDVASRTAAVARMRQWSRGKS